MYSYVSHIVFSLLSFPFYVFREELERKIIQGSIDYRGWPHSDAAKNFVQETAKVNAGQRLTATNALKHVWIEHTVAKSTLPNELVVSLDLYRLAPPLKRVALNALAQKSIASKYRGLFVDLDTTQSGTLTHEEFMEGFKNSGSSPEELKDLFLKLDINGNGEILYTEFLAATLEAEGELEEGQLQEAFDLIDKDHSGYITKKDLMKMFGNPTGTSSSSSPVKATKAVEKTVHKTLDTLHLDKIPFVVNVKKFVDDIFTEKDRIPYEDFAQLFEHGFDARPSMDTIVETSLNEEQLSRLQEDDREEHMTAIRESDE
jgi:Ca2+-binding EF-hand superfamily protein